MRAFFLFFSTFTILIIIGIGVRNWQDVHVLLSAHAATIPLGALVLTCTVLGSAAAGMILAVARSSPATEAKKLSMWRTQDAKLIAQVKSDREKQLEAKIATLETALKSALKK